MSALRQGGGDGALAPALAGVTGSLEVPAGGARRSTAWSPRYARRSRGHATSRRSAPGAAGSLSETEPGVAWGGVERSPRRHLRAGRTACPSTVLMCAIPARAGVRESCCARRRAGRLPSAWCSRGRARGRRARVPARRRGASPPCSAPRRRASTASSAPATPTSPRRSRSSSPHARSTPRRPERDPRRRRPDADPDVVARELLAQAEHDRRVPSRSPRVRRSPSGSRGGEARPGERGAR